MPRKTVLKATQILLTENDKGNNEKQKHIGSMTTQKALGRYTEAFALVKDHPEHDDLQDWLSLADLSQDDTFSFEGCVQLERRWMLWHKFMKEYSCLDDWLRLAEKSAASPNTSHVLHTTAKEELQKFESLRTEARLRLAQVDSLSQTSSILLGLFRGSMKTRLIDMTKECSQRWDRLSTTLDTVCRRLKHFVVQWEDFERQREEMAIWLADLDLKLTEVEHFSEMSTCAKMRQLQGFQEAVAESAGQLNALLQQGEELIQRSEPADAQVIESELQDLLLYCARVFQGLGRLHTRLLSMRLVFEEDWVLCPDSGCPSETLLDEESVKDHSLAPPVQGNPSQICPEQLVLEWDPSVDIGGSMSPNDADSSYLSAGAGVYSTEALLTKDPWRRRIAYLRSAESHPAATEKCIQQTVTECSLDGMAPPQTPVPDADRPLYASFWKTSTPDSHSPEPITFKSDRVSAWLVQTPRLCSRAVQTEHTPQQCSSFYSSPSMQEHKGEEVKEADYLENVLLKRHSCSPHTNNMCSTKSCDLRSHSAKRYPNPQCMKERLNSSDSVKDSSCTKTHCANSEQHLWSPSLLKLLEVLKSPALLCILLALFVVLVIWPPSVFQDNRCYRSNSLAHSFHLALCYVNGPPPT
ncbi:nesprin-2 isoform X1 [Pangasianodon hypophthalmus]|uniref:nesprin-2 isoform X1 n=1 Tax=Pangasianodon hypophthalmus TaxID=310915 RepID=UPI0023078838|nr:nesprin-2 isoform X1 [Pangasianodon hypophthalmus]XP_026779825.3 nesprin-2 isoform X1 [Pangasianodon hypophthalmus]